MFKTLVYIYIYRTFACDRRHFVGVLDDNFQHPLPSHCTAGTGANQSEASSLVAGQSNPCGVEFHACALGEFGDMAQSTK